MGQRYITIPFGRTTGVTSAADFGNYLAGLSIAATNNAGFFATPIQLPIDLDPHFPISVRVLLRGQANTAVPGYVIVLELAATQVYNQVSTDLPIIVYNFAVPNPWVTTSSRLVLLDNGNGYSWPRDTLTPQAQFGLRIRRGGADAADTYPNASIFGLSLYLTYATKFPWLPTQI